MTRQEGEKSIKIKMANANVKNKTWIQVGKRPVDARQTTGSVQGATTKDPSSAIKLPKTKLSKK